MCLLSGRSDLKNYHRKRVNQPIKNAEEHGVSQLGLHCFEILQARNGPTLQGERDGSKYGVESGKVELVATATAGNQHEPCSSHVDVQCKPCERHNPCNEPHDIVLLCRVRRDWAGLRTVAEKRECHKRPCLMGERREAKWIHHVACGKRDLDTLSRIALITGGYKSNGTVHTKVGFCRSARNCARDLVRVSIPARVRR